jgi:transcriptional regulator with XRE-family HTH domain
MSKITDEERKRKQEMFNRAHRDAILNICRQRGIPKSKFAEVYGCSKSYLSQIIAGQRNASLPTLVLTFERLGLSPSFDVLNSRWTFK